MTTSQERVLATFNHQKTDRPPINYFANSGIDHRLKAHYSLKKNDDEGLRKMLGVDFRGISPKYIGSKLYEDIPERNIKVDNWGIHRVWIEHENGGYWDYCEFPLKDAAEETVANWRMPSPDDYDYEYSRKTAENWSAYATYVGHPGLACVINTAGFFRGMDQVFIDLALDDPAGLLMIDRFLDIDFEITRRTLEAAEGKIDFMWIGEDLGTQHSPLISLDMLKKHIIPRQKRFFDLAKAYDLPVMMHSCGSSSWAYEEYIKLGLKVVDTLQPEATNMSPRYLKDTFGDRLAFHGCISTAGPVAYGTVEETLANCQETLDIMTPGGGYCFAPTHSLQDNTPTENVVAIYDFAKSYRL